MEGTVLMPSFEGMKHVRTKEGEMLMKPFIDVCKHILHVLDKFGPSMTILKADIWGNIWRLENKYNSDTQKFNFMYTILLVEVENKIAKSSSSCTNALLWLTRAMDFLVQLFRNLIENPNWSILYAAWLNKLWDMGLLELSSRFVTDNGLESGETMAIKWIFMTKGMRLGNIYCDPLMTPGGHKIDLRQRWTPTPVQLQILESIFD